MDERRKHPRYKIVTRVDVRFPHLLGWAPSIIGNTVDVSREGLAVVLYRGKETTKLVQRLLSKDQSLKVTLELPETGERIEGKGTVKWLDIGPAAAAGSYIRVGIFLEQMNDENRAKWRHLMEDRDRVTRQDAPSE